MEYEVLGKKSSKVKIFFSKKNLNLLGWKTIDAYSNEVNFVIKNLIFRYHLQQLFFHIESQLCGKFH